VKQINLSIITVNYKSWDLLEKYLASFKKYPPQLSYEIIVVDNDSQDGRFDNFSNQYPTIKFIQNSGNHGFSNGCNLGALNANGKYLLFLNPDTELTADNAIDTMYGFIESHSEVGIVSCRTTTPTGEGREINFLNPWLLIPLIKQIYKYVNKEKIRKKYPENATVWYPEWITGSIVFISSQLFNQIGKWNDKRYWMYHEDPDLCLKVRREGKEIALLRNVTIKHINGGVSRSSVESTIRSKTEVIISSHNYIQEHTDGMTRALIHFLLVIKTLLPIIILMIALPFFWIKKYRIQLHVLLKSSQYYLNAIYRRTWRSSKLDILLEEHSL